MRNHEHSAGTASDGYRAEPERHAYQPSQLDWGERPHCRRCGEERSRHETARAEAGR